MVAALRVAPLEIDSVRASLQAGRKQLRREHSQWADFVSAVGQVMGPLPEEGK